MSKFTLEYLQDYIAIRELSAKYNLYANTADGARYAELFTEDGEFCAHGDRTYRGRDQLAKVCSAGKGLVHITTDPLIEVDGDEATQVSQIIVAHRVADKSKNEFVATGMYTDRLVRTPDGWRFKHRRSDVDLDERLLLEAVNLLDDKDWNARLSNTAEGARNAVQ